MPRRIPVLVWTREPTLAVELGGQAFSRRLDLEAEAEHHDQYVVRVADTRVPGWALLCEHQTPVIAIIEDGSVAEEAISAGATWVLTRPVDPGILRANLAAARRLAFLDRERDLDRRTVYTALDLLSEGVEVSGEDRRIIWVNNRFEAMTGFSRGETLGRKPSELFRSGFHDQRYFAAIERSLAEDDEWSGRVVSRCRDGSLLKQHTSLRTIRDGQGVMRRLVAIRQDAELASVRSVHLARELERLSIEAERYRTLVSAIDDAVFIVEHDTGRILEANPAAERMFGYRVSELRGRTGRQLTHPDEQKAMRFINQQLARSGSVVVSGMRLMRKDGTEVFTDLRIARYRANGEERHVTTMRDVSERVLREQALRASTEELQQTQAQLIRSERLAALGQLAASVAHEVNNPLQYVQVSLDAAASRITDPETRQLLVDAQEGVRRIATVAQGMLGFSRTGLRDEVLTIEELVHPVLRMANTEIRHRAQLELELAEIPSFVADGGRLGQVLTNLLINAAQAIEEGQASQNRIRLAAWAEDDKLRITVADTGCGIPADKLELIFEPFYTTKPVGSGTGLGLSVCRQIVEGHGGNLRCTSTLGEGSTVHVELPLVRAEPAKTTAAPLLSGKIGRILIVDDEAPVVRAYQRLLRSTFEVVACTDGRSALTLLEQDQSFDVILCDLMMPEVDGPVFFAALAERPQLQERVVFCSGGAFTPRIRDFIANSTNRLIEKPVSGATLRQVLREVVQGG